MTEPITQITIELVDNGQYVWMAFGEEEKLCGGAAESLSACLLSMYIFLREEGIIT